MKICKKLIIIIIAHALFINTILAQSDVEKSKQKRQKYISIGKKVGAAIGALGLLATGGLSVYFYLRHQEALQDAILKAIHEGKFDVAVAMLNRGIRIEKRKLWCKGSIIEEAIVNGAYLNKNISDQDYLEGITKIFGVMKDEINKPDQYGVTSLFATMHCIQAAAINSSGTERDKTVKRLFGVMDILFAQGVDKNACGPMWSCTTSVPAGTLLHAAAAIPVKQNREDYSVIRQQIIDKIHSYGINKDARDTENRLYTEITTTAEQNAFPFF